MVIVGDVLLTGTLLHLFDMYPPTPPPPSWPNWVRHHGALLVLVPLTWALSATLSARRLDDSPEIQQRWLVTGYVLLSLLVVLLYVSVHSAGRFFWGPMDLRG